MIQLQILAGRQAGTTFQTSRFPSTIGRAGSCELLLDDAGIWDRHLELDQRPGEGYVLRLIPPALATLNGQPFHEAVLRNGDLIEAGGVTLRFWLAPAPRRGMVLRESLTWAGLALLCVFQLAVIYWLLQ